MRDLVIINSSTLFPPHHRPTTTPTSSTTTTTKPHKPYKPPPPPKLSSSFSIPTTTKDLRQDLTPRYTNRLNYYSNLASNLAEAGKFEEFLMIAETVLSTGTDPSLFVGALSIKRVSAGVCGLIRDGRILNVLEILVKIQKLGFSPSIIFDGSVGKLFSVECQQLVDAKELKHVVDLMDILGGLGFPVKEFVRPHEIIELCVENRDPHMAVRYACILPHAHILFRKIIREFGKKGDLVSALTAFKNCKCNLDSPSMYVYRSIIDVCGLCGDFLKSRYIYEELVAQNITPNTYVFNSLMNVNAHDLSYTLHVYKHMKNVGVTADMSSYNILLKACCLAGRVDLAQDIYDEVRRMASTGALKLDVITYSTIIKIFANAKMWQMALKIKEDMLSAGVTPNVVTWSSLISACSSAGLVDKATNVFQEMIRAGCKPNSYCCNSLLQGCIVARQYDRAFRLFQSWKENRYRRTSERTNYNRDSDGKVCINVKQSSEHGFSNLQNHSNPSDLGIFETVRFTPTNATYSMLMKACGSDYYRAYTLMNEMKMLGLSPDHICWTNLIDVCGRSGNVEASLQVLKTMREAGVEPCVVAYGTAIKACVDSENLKMAFSLFEEMKGYHLQPNLATYKTLLRARSRYGSLQEVQQCMAVYQDMRKAGYSPNDYFLKELVEEWCEGVIQDNNKNQGSMSLCASHDKTDGEKPHSLLLEKVAEHLHRNNAHSLAIDLRGLTKVEARIVVLAVLRMIKENYTAGEPIKDDIVILLEAVEHSSEVQDAVVKLLRDELGLTVVHTGPSSSLNGNNPVRIDPVLNRQNQRKEGLPLVSSPKRPALLNRLNVTRKSLYQWVEKRVGITVRRNF